MEAARRLQNRAYYLETLAVAELARRRAAQHAEDAAAGVPRHQRRAQFPDLELAAQLLTSRRHAQHLLDQAAELTGRLPHTLAGMAAGLIDQARASAIASATLCLSDADAARVDQALGPTAHEARADTVAHRAAALAMKLDPEAVRREKEDAQRTRQRVEARREQSGNASFSIREADTSLVMSIEAAINDLAVRLRNGGAQGTLDTLRAMAAMDRLLARDPLDRLAPVPPEPPAEDDEYPEDCSETPSTTVPPAAKANHGGHPGPRDADESGNGDRNHRLPADDSGADVPASGQAKFPALINLIVPAATLLGWAPPPARPAPGA